MMAATDVDQVIDLLASRGGADATATREFLSRPDVKAAVRAVQLLPTNSRPTTMGGAAVLNEVASLLGQFSGEDAAKAAELRAILESPLITLAVSVHDRLASQISLDTRTAAPASAAAGVSGEQVLEVQIDKGDAPLGATIMERDGKVVVARIIHGSVAQRSKQLHVDDEVLEVNGLSTSRMKPDDIVAAVRKSGRGPVHFKIRRKGVVNGDLEDTGEAPFFVRALFDYDPSSDDLIPCKEAGIRFHRGDILHVLNTRDQYWWQVRKEGSEAVGIAPSLSLEDRRQRALQLSEASQNNAAAKKEKRKSFVDRLSIRRKSVNKAMKQTQRTGSSIFVLVGPLIYERVVQRDFLGASMRPVVLCGPTGVGRNTLCRRLLEGPGAKFVTPVPHTSRAMREGEANGREYFFVSREEMQRDVAAGKFIEHGEYNGNLYGTTFETVRQMSETRRICVLDVHPSSVVPICNSDVGFAIIFIKPPSMDVLKKTRKEMKESALKDLVTHAEMIESSFGGVFDAVVVNGNIDAALNDLRVACDSLCTGKQWVSAGIMRV